MPYRQPSELSRVMSQVLDRLGPGQVVTLEFGNREERERGLAALHEVATARAIGVIATPVHRYQIALRLADAQAA